LPILQGGNREGWFFFRHFGSIIESPPRLKSLWIYPVIFSLNILVFSYLCWKWIHRVQVRGDCSFCWYWWICWTSLFKLSIHNVHVSPTDRWNSFIIYLLAKLILFKGIASHFVLLNLSTFLFLFVISTWICRIYRFRDFDIHYSVN
jgi:hypothetical protein